VGAVGAGLEPLAARGDFAPEYRNLSVSKAVDAMMTILRAPLT
jgi:hypothetical protein